MRLMAVLLAAALTALAAVSMGGCVIEGAPEAGTPAPPAAAAPTASSPSPAPAPTPLGSAANPP